MSSQNTPEVKRASRQTAEGWVVSDKMAKTRVVEVRWSKRHPNYGKIVRKTTKLFAHDEKNESHTGDRVKVMESRPLSRLKRWVVTDVLSKSKVK